MRVTGGAASKAAFPGWVAVIEHKPVATSVTVEPATVQTAGVPEAKPTARPELAVAVTVNDPIPKLTSMSGGNVIVCAVAAAGFTVKL